MTTEVPSIHGRGHSIFDEKANQRSPYLALRTRVRWWNSFEIYMFNHAIDVKLRLKQGNLTYNLTVRTSPDKNVELYNIKLKLKET